jgi:hypothetical protein
MSDEVDPRWPPPVAKPSDEIDPNWPPPPANTADEINPGWAPPQPQPFQPVSPLPSAADPYPTPLPNPATPGTTAERRSRVWLLALAAGIVGIAAGVVVAVSVLNHGGSSQNATSPTTPAGSAQVFSTTPSPVTTLVPPPLAIAPPNAIALNPTDGQHVYVRTESGSTRCVVGADRVDCQYLQGFPQAPVEAPSNCPPPPGTFLNCVSGIHLDIAGDTPAGAFQWNDGNLPADAFVHYSVLNYGQTYGALGWTILPSSDGTRFTNDSTGHGMFVSIQNVNSF